MTLKQRAINLIMLHDFQTPGHGGDKLTFEKSGTDLDAVFWVHEKQKKAHNIKFRGLQMVSFRTEPFSLGFMAKSYDCLCEVSNSDWIQKLDRRTHKGEIRHFAVYFSNCGFLEVAASAVEIDENFIS